MSTGKSKTSSPPESDRVRRDDLYTDHGLSSALDERLELDKALKALHPDDTLVITTLDRLGSSTQKMLDLVEELSARNFGLLVLNLGADGDNKTPMGAMVFTVMTALAQMQLEIER